MTLNATAGRVSVSQQITTSGAVSSGSAASGGSAGAISITGAGGVSISAPLVAVGKTGSNGDITISDGNATVTSAGVNDGVSSVITGRNFTKSGVGVLNISGTNAWTGTTTISGGTLQLGTGTNIPNTSAVYLSGGDLNDGGFRTHNYFE